MESGERRDRARRWSLAGAVAAALAASACCIGPLLVGVLGLGSAGAFAVFGAYRVYILGATAALLGLGHYLTYRPRRSGDRSDADACGCEKRAKGRAGHIGLWMATATVVLFAAIPPVLGMISSQSEPSAVGTEAHPTDKVVIQVQGIDCEACAKPIQAALSRVGGFRDLALDIPRRSVTVTYVPAPGRLQAYVAAIEELGYEASLPTTPWTTDEKR